MKSVLSWALSIVIALVVIDVIGFLAWGVSGQAPADGFYIGAATHALVKLMF